MFKILLYMDILAIIGAVTFSIGWAWLAVTAFQKGGWIWGIVVILFNWIGGLIFCIVHKTGWLQYLIFVIGALLFTMGITSNKFFR